MLCYFNHRCKAATAVETRESVTDHNDGIVETVDVHDVITSYSANRRHSETTKYTYTM